MPIHPVSQTPHWTQRARRLINSGGRSSVSFVLFVLILVTVVYAGHAVSSYRAAAARPQAKNVARGEDKLVQSKINSASEVAWEPVSAERLTTLAPDLNASLFLPLPQAGSGAETVTTYAADCSTPKSSFNLGDTVCAKIVGGPPLSIVPRRFSWVSPDNVIQQRAEVTLDPQTDLFTLPAPGSGTDYRGLWRVNSISTRSSVRASAFFNVKDPNDAATNLVVYTNINTDASNVAAGSNVEFALWIVNRGPDDALNVQLTNTASNATFVTSAQDSGPSFSCSPAGATLNCTIASLAAGATARIRVVYQLNAGAAVGTVVTDIATISSSTPEKDSADNSSEAEVAVTADGNGSFCALVCPGNIIKSADAMQNGESGAFVTFGTGETSGDCGTVTANIPSGSFFPVGDTTVMLTSSSGESCTFLVRVSDTAPPTISCPGNLQKDAGTECSATLTEAELGTPTATGDGVTVSGQRSDGALLDAPYPVGTTIITWTATDATSRTATCQQTVLVTGNDTLPPTITAPPDVNDSTGTSGAACGKIVGETTLGTPTASDNCSVTVTRTGVPAGNFFPVGTTTITYTATDGAGNTATATQQVTIIDNTPPTILAPPDASYTCPSEVPAADPSQAHGDDPSLPNGGPVTDNCGVPTVTISETNSGTGSAGSPLIIQRTFTATDNSGNSASAVQTITVTDSTPPTISLNGNSSVTIECHTAFTDPGATASDNCGTATVDTNSNLDMNAPGTYTITYTATDAVGNQSSPISRTVIVTDTIPPTITLNGANPMTVECHTTFVDPGATADDGCAGSLAVSATSNVNANVPGTYLVTYSAHDPSGNTTTSTRTVKVVDTTPPTITLKNVTINLWPPNHRYQTINVTDLVQSASDGCDGDVDINDVFISKVTSDEVENGNGDGNTMNDIVIASSCKSVQLRAEREGDGNGRVYTITFKVRDASGNATTVTAKVYVPHNSGETVVDSGVHYTVNGNCP